MQPEVPQFDNSSASCPTCVDHNSDIVHITDGYEHLLRKLAREYGEHLSRLSDVSHALKNGKIDIAREFIDRARNTVQNHLNNLTSSNIPEGNTSLSCPNCSNVLSKKQTIVTNYKNMVTGLQSNANNHISQFNNADAAISSQNLDAASDHVKDAINGLQQDIGTVLDADNS